VAEPARATSGRDLALRAGGDRATPSGGGFDMRWMSARNEYSVFIDDAKRQRILHGLFDNYYAGCPAEVIFDTNRAWCAWMPAIARPFPDAKVIACVRELPWVIDSIERLVQRKRL
jgi:hypothetical protein